MEALTNRDYNQRLMEFLSRSDDWKKTTSLMDSNGRYISTYICSNGEVATEIVKPITKLVKVEVDGVEMEMEMGFTQWEFIPARTPSFATYEPRRN